MVNSDLLRLTRIHREGSFNTQRSRKAHVRLIARHLAEGGFKRLKADNLKPKHVTALVERWKRDGISIGTFKNRMGALRWVYAKVNKHFLVPRTNAELGIGNRQYVTNENKARELTDGVRRRGQDQESLGAHEPGAAARLRAAAGRIPEDPAGLGGPGTQAGAAGVVDEGRATAGNPDSQRASNARSWSGRRRWRATAR